MPLSEINYAAGQDNMDDVFDKTNLAIVKINSIYDDGQLPGGVETDGTLLKTKVVTIGDWDMDAAGTKAVAHGIASYKKIRSIDIIIRDDADSVYSQLQSPSLIVDGVRGGVTTIDSTNVNLYRLTADLYDSTNYNSTTYNRGFITITYEV